MPIILGFKLSTIAAGIGFVIAWFSVVLLIARVIGFSDETKRAGDE